MSARRISIIIPARNEAAQIRGTIEAVLAAVDELRRAETAAFIEARTAEVEILLVDNARLCRKTGIFLFLRFGDNDASILTMEARNDEASTYGRGVGLYCGPFSTAGTDWSAATGSSGNHECHSLDIEDRFALARFAGRVPTLVHGLGFV